MMMMMMAGAGAGVRRSATGLRNLSTQSNRILEDANAKRKKLTLTETLKQYGVTAVAFHSTVYVTTLGSFYFAIENGFDTSSMLEQYLNIKIEDMPIPESAGNLALAYVSTAIATSLPRGMLTVAATPLLAKYIRRKKN